MAHHYDPNQPRVPAGHDGAGQWTDGIPASLSELEAYFNHRDGDRHEVPMRLALLDQKKGSSALDWVISTLPPRYRVFGRAAQAAYSFLSRYNDSDQRTVLAFRSHEFRRNGYKAFEYEDMRILTGDEIKEKCGEIDKIQEYTDQAFEETKHLEGAERGQAVHKLVEQWIKEDSDKRNSKLKNVKAEITFAKEDSETGDKYTNAKDTVRIDVFTKVDDKTVCIHDIKTSYKGLSYKRMQELLAAASRKYPGIEQVFITEVWPTGVRFPRGRRRR